jgi:thiamine-monophosphate kinase
LARIATACIDVSDGCVQDLGHLCRASGVGAQIDATTLPLDPGFETACGALGADPVEVALTGGEDYELLFTAPRSKEADSIGTPIGSIVSGSAIVVRGADGEPLSLRTGGFRHFS